jgi:hypothetical protein
VDCLGPRTGFYATEIKGVLTQILPFEIGRFGMPGGPDAEMSAPEHSDLHFETGRFVTDEPPVTV